MVSSRSTRRASETYMKYSILILGASYGSLLGTKLLMAGHRVCLVCTRPTAELIKREGTRVRFPLSSPQRDIEIVSQTLPGSLSAATPDEIDPGAFDLIVLGMQEPQCGTAGVRELMSRIARSGKPCLAIMNMPPLPYLERVPGVFTASLRSCYLDSHVWDGFEPALVTLASPDAQAFRPPGEPKNILHVGLATNLKAARFDDEAPTALLRQLEADIEEARYCDGNEAPMEIPVKLKVHDSIFVPLAKWPMLLAGNYRCIRPTEMVSIKHAVHGDIEASRQIYEWVAELCIGLGAAPTDLVPFEKYARAAEGLGKPSSAARALSAGAQYIERVDSLVQRIARQRGMQSGTLRAIVNLVDARLQQNREKHSSSNAVEVRASAA